MSEFNEGDHVYLEDGQIVEYQAKLKSGHLVSPLYERENDFGETDLYPHGNKKVATVFSKEPVLKYSDRVLEVTAELNELRRQKRDAEKDALDAEDACAKTLAHLEKYKGLELLRDYIDGKITHFAVSNHEGIHVSTWDDLMLYQEDFRDKNKRKIKCLQLYGDSDGNLTWGINVYSNFPASPAVVFPCTSKQMAIDKCQSMAIAKMDKERVKNDDKQRRPWVFANAIKQAIKLGVQISADDQEWLDAYHQEKAREEKKKLLEDRAKLDAKLAELS